MAAAPSGEFQYVSRGRLIVLRPTWEQDAESILKMQAALQTSAGSAATILVIPAGVDFFDANSATYVASGEQRVVFREVEVPAPKQGWFSRLFGFATEKEASHG